MNTKYMILCSFSFVFSLNSMSPVDEYEHAREEFRKCDSSWSGLLYGCDEQRAAFDKARERLERPFNEIIEEAEESHKILTKTYPRYHPSKPFPFGNSPKPLPSIDEQRAAYKKYFEKEKDYGLNATRHWSACNIKEIIDRDQFLDSKRFFKRVVPIDKKMLEEIKDTLEERYSSNRTIRHPYMYDLLHNPENSKKIDLVADEMKKEINKLQTKSNVQ